MFLYGAAGGFLHAGENEIGDCPALKGGGMLDQRLLVTSESGFEPFGANSPWGTGFEHLSIVRLMAGQVKI